MNYTLMKINYFWPILYIPRSYNAKTNMENMFVYLFFSKSYHVYENILVKNNNIILNQ